MSICDPMNPHCFRAYDIRGDAERDLTDDFCRLLGRAIGTYVARDGGSMVALGRDARLSSPRIRDAIVDGITATGVAVADVGVVPSPVLYFAAKHWKLDGHVMITGSHNPAGDNGLKLASRDTPLHGDAIQALRRIIEAGDYASADRAAIDTRDALTPYVEFCKSSLHMGARRFPLAVDAGNGVGGPAAIALYRALGFDPIELYCEPDGNFPNHHPDPTVEANLADLQARVRGAGAELGIALDGDADRIGVVDSSGRILWGDQLMILFGRAILREVPNATFIAEVKCSQALFDELEKAGGTAIMWNVGHSFIKAKMKETGADLAGEMSGHIFFANRYLGYDDGIYAGARLLELLSQGDDTLAQLYETLPKMVNTPEIRLPCPDELKFGVVERAAARLRARADVRSVIDVDGARAVFDGGWGLVRASNTGPVLVVRCEARDEARLAEIRGIIEGEIEAARGTQA